MQRAQSTGDTAHELVMTGQVAAEIHDLVRIAEFVPTVAAEAAAILARLGESVRRSAAV